MVTSAALSSVGNEVQMSTHLHWVYYFSWCCTRYQLIDVLLCDDENSLQTDAYCEFVMHFKH